jgi:hypothetical protein
MRCESGISLANPFSVMVTYKRGCFQPCHHQPRAQTIPHRMKVHTNKGNYKIASLIHDGGIGNIGNYETAALTAATQAASPRTHPTIARAGTRIANMNVGTWHCLYVSSILRTTQEHHSEPMLRHFD